VRFPPSFFFFLDALHGKRRLARARAGQGHSPEKPIATTQEDVPTIVRREGGGVPLMVDFIPLEPNRFALNSPHAGELGAPQMTPTGSMIHLCPGAMLRWSGSSSAL